MSIVRKICKNFPDTTIFVKILRKFNANVGELDVKISLRIVRKFRKDFESSSIR